MPDNQPCSFRCICGSVFLLAIAQAAAAGDPLGARFDASPRLLAGAGRPVPADEPEIRELHALHVEGLTHAWQAAQPGDRIPLVLHDDATLDLDVVRAESPGPGRAILTGQLADQPASSFTLVVAGDVLVGNIRTPDGPMYQLRYTADGEPVLLTVDEADYAPCGTDHAHAVEPAGDDCLRGTSDDGSTFDVLVAYTPAARSAAGGVAAMHALIDLAISETNTAYANSQIVPRVRLVHRVELNYTETGNPSLELDRLRSTSDGFLDGVHALRDDYGADLVTLLVSQMNGACGIGYLMTGLNTGFASSAFSVTRLSCATGNLTFGHELGHNMGCAHDRDNASVGVFSYSFGYRTPDSAYRTVMAYAPGQRIPYFSNPSVSFAGRALGIAPGQPNAAHNALSINNAALTVANFRAGRDCNDNGIDDRCEISCGAVPECPGPPLCGQVDDCDGNTVPDECELQFNDCNGNGVHDACDVQDGGSSEDCNATGVPDECELAGADCNANAVPDTCDAMELFAAIAGPQAAGVCAGSPAVFTVEAPPGSTYQWYRGQTPLANSAKYAGVTSPELTVFDAQASDEGLYSCRVALGCVSAFSADAALNIVPSTLTIAQQPVATLTLCGATSQSASFECRASSEIGVSYRWYKDGEPLSDDGRLSGTHSSRLLIQDAAPNDEGTYTCTAVNACGGETASDPSRGRLSIVGANIITQPRDTCAPVGGSARFRARLDASPQTQFFWYREGELLSDGTDRAGMVITGASTPTLTLRNVPAAYAGDQFQLVTFLNSPTCIGQSETAELAVGNCGPCGFAGDMDGDLDVDLRDLARFASCFSDDGESAGYCTCADLDAQTAGLELSDWQQFEQLVDGPQ